MTITNHGPSQKLNSKIVPLFKDDQQWIIILAILQEKYCISNEKYAGF